MLLGLVIWGGEGGEERESGTVAQKSFSMNLSPRDFNIVITHSHPRFVITGSLPSAA